MLFRSFDENGEELVKHETVDSLDVGDEIKCIIKFKKIQFRKKKGEWVLSLQTGLQQVKIMHTQ